MNYETNISYKIDFLQTENLSFSIIDVSGEETDHPVEKIDIALRYIRNSRIQKGQAAYATLEGFEVEDIYEDIIQSRSYNIPFHFVVSSEEEVSFGDFAKPQEKIYLIISEIAKKHKGNILFLFKTTEQKTKNAHQLLRWACAIEGINPISILYTIVQNYLVKTNILVILYIDEEI